MNVELKVERTSGRKDSGGMMTIKLFKKEPEAESKWQNQKTLQLTSPKHIKATATCIATLLEKDLKISSGFSTINAMKKTHTEPSRKEGQTR